MTGLRWLAVMAALAMLAAACGEGGGGTDTASEAPADGASETESAGGDDGVLVVGTTEKSPTLDPAEVYSLMGSNILYNTTDQLVALEPGTDEVVGSLAEDWEISDDGTTYTFTLREGVTFHDGSELTSEDVKYSLERSSSINHPNGASFLIGAIESIEAPDDLTVEITIAEANSTFLSRLAYTVASVIPSDSDVYPAAPEDVLGNEGEPAALEEADEFVTKDQIVGSGPYELTEYSPESGATLEAFEDYWGEAPATPTVRLQYFESAAQMTNALRNGEIDININDLGPAERGALEQEEGIVVEKGEGGRTRYIIVDVESAPFDDAAVRRAISANIDRERIVEEVFEGAAEPLYSMIPPSYSGYADHMSEIEVEDLPDAPIKFELWYPLNKYGDTEPDVAETIARSLNESGQFDVTTKSADYASEYSNNLGVGSPYGIYLLGWYPDYIDPDDYIEPFYFSEGFIGHYKSDEMDALIKEEQQETDPAAREEIFDQIQQLAAEDMPFIPLYQETPHAYYREGLTGVENSIDVAQSARWYLIGTGE